MKVDKNTGPQQQPCYIFSVVFSVVFPDIILSRCLVKFIGRRQKKEKKLRGKA
jgi:hypothetical protein